MFYKYADVDSHNAGKIENLGHLDLHNLGKPLRGRTTLVPKAEAGCERGTKNLSISIFHPGEKHTNPKITGLV